MKVKSVESLKEKLGNELGRLQKRYRESKNPRELDSLSGSILTVKKIMRWLE